MTTTLASGVPPEALGRRAQLLRVHEQVASLREQLADAPTVAEDAFWTGERLRQEYLDLLPDVTVSRCPHTGTAVTAPVDTVDLDGLWWAYFTPLRRVGALPPPLLARTGALRLGGSPPRTSFLVKPGPAVPYVLPRLLEEPTVLAVVAELPIGPHTGYVIAYFSPAADELPLRANDWGANDFVRRRADGSLEWGAVPDDEGAMDFDLRPWLEAERLRWIAPGDADASLRSGVAGCPFLDLAGRREVQRIEEGEVR